MDVTQAFQNAQKMRMERICKSFSNAGDVLRDDTNLSKAEADAELEKAQGDTEGIDQNPFDLAAEEIEKGEGNEEEEVEKSDILNAVSSYGNPIKFFKTGKEIKEKLKGVRSEKEAALSQAKKSADEILEDCGIAPSAPVPTYWTGELKLDVGYKMYDWNQTYYNEKTSNGVGGFYTSSLSPAQQKEKEKKDNSPETEAQAECRRNYNNQVRIIAEVMTDIKAIDILDENLKDGSSYQLDPRQIMAFGFK